MTLGFATPRRTRRPRQDAIVLNEQARKNPWLKRFSTVEGHSRLRLLARQHAGALARRLLLYHSHPAPSEVIERPANHEGVFTFDLSQDGRE
jgi:hypothetical protein